MARKYQREEEIAWFVDLLATEGVRSYLEIGSKFGGSLDRVARALPKGSRVVSLDRNVNGPSLQDCINKLNGSGYDAWLIPLDSTSTDAVERATALGPYDAVFIDADHTLPYVTKDWLNYGPLGRIVAFHDIGYVAKPERPKGIEVPQFWESIKGDFRHQECKLDVGHNGIGVLWRE
jgi:predicted O-methyltransferase YrrM